MQLYHPAAWFRPGQGPRYEQLYRHLSQAIADGALPPDSQIPPERDLARLAEVSRVTLRKTMALLAADGVVDQRRGAGSYIRRAPRREVHSLTALLSFTDYMRQRGRDPVSRILRAEVTPPTPDEKVALALSGPAQVARLDRLRLTAGETIALERTALPADLLPDPASVTASLYEVLRQSGHAPARAVQRISAMNLTVQDATLMGLPAGTAILRIERTAYLPSGRPVEFTRGLYRPDIYDFIAELRLDEAP